MKPLSFLTKPKVFSVKIDLVLITGAGGLVGGNLSEHYLKQGARVIGIDDDSRKKYFGTKASTNWRIQELEARYSNFSNYQVNISNRDNVFEIFSKFKPDLILHAAAQPSHDYAAQNVYSDFEANAVGTLNILESTRRFSPDANFVHFSTNKVYGDSINNIAYTELDFRFEFSDETFLNGINENQTIDRSRHSLFGVSKTFADLAAQEYGLNFGLKTTILRGGCLTGPHHSASEAHGFLSFMVHSAINGVPYNVHGYKGKQVRDNIHTGDIARLVDLIAESPNQGEVFNLGGGYNNSISILEAIDILREDFSLELKFFLNEKERFGDHRVYYSSNQKLHQRYPSWQIQKDLREIIEDLLREWKNRI